MRKTVIKHHYFKVHCANNLVIFKDIAVSLISILDRMLSWNK